MDQVQFTAADVDNLQRLIDAEPPLEEEIKNERVIEDPDIMFFSQFGTLPPSNHPVPHSEFAKNANANLQNAPSDLSLDPLLPLATNVKDEEPPTHFVKLKQQEGKSVKVFECGICGKEFGHQYTLIRHLPTHTDERKFNCVTCGKAFRQMSTLSQHRAIHSSERPYVCEVCCKTFNRVSTLISHRKTHTGVKPHRCHLCNKAFHQKGNLRNHVFTHTNERPYRCDICEKGFNQMSNLMCHKLKAHQQYDVIPKYTCKICGEDFLKRINLRQHEQYQHGLGNVEQTVVAPAKFDYANAIIVDPIKTEAMRLALESNKTPFALLRPLSGIPVLVRVLPAGSKQLLVPATADDLKKHGHISITPKTEPGIDEVDGNFENKENQVSVKSSGSVVQIKVPVVATVIQRPSSGSDRMNMSVVSPGPADAMHDGGKTGDSNYVFSSSLSGASGGASNDTSSTITAAPDNNTAINDMEKQMIADAEFQFLDENQKLLTEQEFTASFELNNQFDFELQNANSLNDLPNQTATPNSVQVTANENFSPIPASFTNNSFSVLPQNSANHTALTDNVNNIETDVADYSSVAINAVKHSVTSYLTNSEINNFSIPSQTFVNSTANQYQNTSISAVNYNNLPSRALEYTNNDVNMPAYSNVNTASEYSNKPGSVIKYTNIVTSADLCPVTHAENYSKNEIQNLAADNHVTNTVNEYTNNLVKCIPTSAYHYGVLNTVAANTVSQYPRNNNINSAAKNIILSYTGSKTQVVFSTPAQISNTPTGTVCANITTAYYSSTVLGTSPQYTIAGNNALLKNGAEFTDSVVAHDIVKYTDMSTNIAKPNSADIELKTGLDTIAKRNDIVVDGHQDQSIVVEKVAVRKPGGPAKDMPLLCDFGPAVEE